MVTPGTCDQILLPLGLLPGSILGGKCVPDASHCSTGSAVNPTPDFPVFQRGNSTHIPRGIHFLTFSLQVWECGAVSCTHRLPRGSFHPIWLSYPPLSTKILFSTFILGRKGVFNPKFEIICSGFSFHSSEPRWEKGLNFVNPCYPKLRKRWE